MRERMVNIVSFKLNAAAGYGMIDCQCDGKTRVGNGMILLLRRMIKIWNRAIR